MSLDLIALLPFIVLAVAAAVVMLAVAYFRSHALTVGLTLLGLLVAFAMLPLVPLARERQATALLLVDDFALFYTGLLLAAGFAVAALSYAYFDGREADPGSYYVLLLLATLGASVLAASTHFASFFLGLELLSVSLYAMIAFTRDREVSVEAGVKYLILAGASSAFLLFGMALVYADLGALALPDLAAALAADEPAASILSLAGLSVLVVGVGFKLAVVPFHLWTPDVYQGAPAPTTAFIATVSKGGVFAVLLRFFTQIDVQRFLSLFAVFAIIAIASMFAGNLLALLQSNVKRILAYSSISHLGYLLVAFLAGGTLAVTAGTFYLVAYVATTLGAFGVVSALSTAERDMDRLEDYRGLFWRRRWLAVAFTAMLLSLAGIPLTAGFIGKFYLALAGIGAAGGGLAAPMWALVLSLALASVIGLYYYLRVAAALYRRPEGAPAPAGAARGPTVGDGVLLAALTVALLALGVFPVPLIDLIQTTAGTLVQAARGPGV